MPKVSMKRQDVFTIQNAIEYFMRKGAVKNLSPETIVTYKRRLKPFVEFINDGTTPVSNISKSTVDDYTLHLIDSNSRNEITVNSYLRHLRVFLYFCMDEGYLPLTNIGYAKYSCRIRVLY
jgi:integrase/recombinase XerD